MKHIAIIGLAVTLAGFSRMAMAGCMDEAPNRDELIRCSKTELVLPENRAADAEASLRQRYRSDAVALASFDEAKRQWGTLRDARCVEEGKEALARSKGRVLEQERATLICLRDEFTQRADQLEAEVTTAPGASVVPTARAAVPSP